jgi:hypothetical protein
MAELPARVLLGDDKMTGLYHAHSTAPEKLQFHQR